MEPFLVRDDDDDDDDENADGWAQWTLSKTKK